MNWGCEFLDYGEVREFVAAPQYGEDVIFVPSKILKVAVDKDYIHSQRFSWDKVDCYERQIRQDGLKKPGLLITNGTVVKLQDGNHRFQACLRLDYEYFPVRLEVGRQKVVNGASTGQMLLEMLKLT